MTSAPNTAKNEPSTRRKRRVLAVQNVKGGVGKTTVAVNLAALLVEKYRKKVLLIDADPQCNASLYLLRDEEFLLRTGSTPGAASGDGTKEVGNLWDLFHKDVHYIDVVTGRRHGPRVEAKRFVDVVKRGSGGGALGLVCGSARLSDIQEMAPELVVSRIGRWLQSPSSGDAELVIIDCPPSIGSLTLSALRAADEILVPMIPDAFALHGLPLLLGKLDEYAKVLRIKCRVTGVLFTLYPPEDDSLRARADRYAERLRELCGMGAPAIRVLPGYISRHPAYPESLEQKQPLPFIVDRTVATRLVPELDKVVQALDLAGGDA